MAEAFPLEWPEGWPRTTHYNRKWSLPGGRGVSNWNNTVGRLMREVKRMGANHVVLSTDMPLRQDGLPYARTAGGERIQDPGCAVYFQWEGRSLVMAQDTYELLFDNIRSLAIAVEHFRGLHRHGGGVMMDRVFSGFEALPSPESVSSNAWHRVLGVEPDATIDEVRLAYRRAAKTAHPDHGGDPEDMARLNEAWMQAQASFKSL